MTPNAKRLVQIREMQKDIASVATCADDKDVDGLR